VVINNGKLHYVTLHHIVIEHKPFNVSTISRFNIIEFHTKTF